MALAEDIYEEIFNEEDGRICKGIPEDACTDVPRNFFRHLLSRIATKVADALSKPGLVLTWLLMGAGAPEFLLGALAPVREAGALFPQLLVGGYIRGVAVRKGFWVAGSLGQALAVFAMAIVALTLDGALLGWLIVGLLVLFSLSRGVMSVTTKDLVGKTVPKRRRGRLGGLAGSIAGGFSVIFGSVLFLFGISSLPTAVLAGMLGVAALLWCVAAAVMVGLEEQPGATEGGANAIREAVRSLHYFISDRQFLTFCIARGLLAGTVLSMPFYVALTRDAADGASMAFAALMAVSGLAQLMSSFAWGSLADWSSRWTLVLAGLLGAAIGLLTFGIARLEPDDAGWTWWIFGGLYFLMVLSHTGIRLGRKTYLVDFAPEEKRPAYVALSNTAIGIVLLASSGLGAIASYWGSEYLILVFSVLGLAGAVTAWWLPEAEEA